MSLGRKTRTTFLAALMVGATAFAALAASPFEGTWSVKDSGGKPFDITLGPDGKAASTHPKAMTGTWTEEGGAAVIKWTSGWTTKIVKDGDQYKKEAFQEDGSPSSTSEAQKK
jgi:hypothetical protein